MGDFLPHDHHLGPEGGLHLVFIFGKSLEELVLLYDLVVGPLGALQRLPKANHLALRMVTRPVYPRPRLYSPSWPMHPPPRLLVT